MSLQIIPFPFRKNSMMRSPKKDLLVNHSTKGIPNVDLLTNMAKVTSGAINKWSFIKSLTTYLSYKKRPLYNKFGCCNVRFDVYGNGLATKSMCNI